MNTLPNRRTPWTAGIRFRLRSVPSVLPQDAAEVRLQLRIVNQSQLRAEVEQHALAIERGKPVSCLAPHDFVFVEEHVRSEVDAGNRRGVEPRTFAPQFLVVAKIAAGAAKVAEAVAAGRAVKDSCGTVEMNVEIVQGQKTGKERRVRDVRVADVPEALDDRVEHGTRNDAVRQQRQRIGEL